MTASRVSVVIVTWNSGDVLRACVESLLAQSLASRLEVIVVDNASTDGSLGSISNLADSRLTLEQLGENTGFGHGCNVGALATTGDYLFFLNPDAVLPSRTALEVLVTVLDEDPRTGLVGPKLVYPDGRLQPSVAPFPTVHGALLVGSGAHRLLPDTLRARFAPAHWSQSYARSVDWLRGAALLIRREVFDEIGGFSEATFMYGEDLELAYDVRAHGHAVRYEPTAAVVHHDDHSARQRWSTPQRVARVARGELTFLARHYPRPRRAAIRAIWASAYLLRLMLFRALRNREKAATYGAMAAVYCGVR